jgi:hypothetical protein
LVDNGGMDADPRRLLPKVDVLLGHPSLRDRAAAWGQGPVLGAARRVLDESRRAVAGGVPVPGVDELAARVAGELDAIAARRIRAVVNATGVVLHTNLGRAPLSTAAQAAVAAAAGYASVEYDLAKGTRGRRGAAAEPPGRRRRQLAEPSACGVRRKGDRLTSDLSPSLADLRFPISSRPGRESGPGRQRHPQQLARGRLGQQRLGSWSASGLERSKCRPR